MRSKLIAFAALIVAAAGSTTACAAYDDRYPHTFERPGGGVYGLFESSPIPRQTVRYDGPFKPGTVVISTSERRLYLVQNDGTALRYGIGVGREGFQWSGTQPITRKAEWPDWRPPAQMLKRRPDLPRYMPGGPNNPLGARAMYLGSSMFRIHGSNEPETIGTAVSSGCIRMTNDDVIDLYNRVRVGTTVVVKR
jgi:lipoprotein-anchoring transpeptidase ErfK/SrfK